MTPRIAEIQMAVSRHYGLAREEMKAPTRTHRVTRPRQVAMWLASYQTRCTPGQIGQAFKRDRTTVLHACEAVEKRRSDPDLQRDLAAIREAIDKLVEGRSCSISAERDVENHRDGPVEVVNVGLGIFPQSSVNQAEGA